MFKFLKEYATWFSIAFHSFMLFFAMFVSVTGIDMPSWVYGFFLFYIVYIVISFSSKNKKFKQFINNIRFKK